MRGTDTGEQDFERLLRDVMAAMVLEAGAAPAQALSDAIERLWAAVNDREANEHDVDAAVARLRAECQANPAGGALGRRIADFFLAVDRYGAAPEPRNWWDEV